MVGLSGQPRLGLLQVFSIQFVQNDNGVIAFDAGYDLDIYMYMYVGTFMSHHTCIYQPSIDNDIIVVYYFQCIFYFRPTLPFFHPMLPFFQ